MWGYEGLLRVESDETMCGCAKRGTSGVIGFRRIGS
jgi:hypothetical protein